MTWGTALMKAQQWLSQQGGSDQVWYQDLVKTECLMGESGHAGF